MKKALTLVLALLMVTALVSCANDKPKDESTTTTEAKTISLKVWASQDDQDLTKELCEKFAAANPDNKYEFTYGVVGEPDAFKNYSTDPADAADVFSFANDQLRDFVEAGALYEVTRNKDDIISRNVPGSIEGATLDGKLYAYPATADNGYFLYYDKSVLSEDDVKSLDGILKVAGAADKKVFMDVSNGWYIASFFLGNGCKLSIEDGKQVCDFNNANGLAAAEAIKAFCADPAFITGDDDVLKGGIGGTIACGVSGAWTADAISETLGDNYAATKLPTFTADGQQVQMGSFGGYKLFGVNAMISDVDKAVAACDLADFLTNEDSQIERFKARSYGPSNINAASDPAVLGNVALAALAQQNQFATPQNDVLGNFWDPSEAFGTAMEAKDKTDLQKLLDQMVANIEK
jgi:arabinogalactan oligomer/maltooligosaccharide transport system substrate-binding protein